MWSHVASSSRRMLPMQTSTRSLGALLVIAFIAIVQAASAKVFLAHPMAEAGDETWYRSSFTVEHVPDSALLQISTAGYVLVYVNGRVAFPETMWPYRPLIGMGEGLCGASGCSDSLSVNSICQQGIATRRIDIKPLLRYGRNVLAVWYAPCRLDEARQLPQIAATLTLRKGSKETVVIDEDSEWTCHTATSRRTLNGEDDDALAYDSDWKREDNRYDKTWVAPERILVKPVSWNTIEDNGLMACRTVRAKANARTDSTQLFYTPTVVTGQLKVTLRGTSKGQLLLINGMRYRCNGTTDEQFITRFATVTTDCIEIKNTSGRKFPDVQNVEILALKPIYNNSNYEQYH